MRASRKVAPWLVSLMLLLLACAVGAQQEMKQQTPPAMPSQADMDAMMKASMPGAEQKHMARMAGDWTFVNKAWMVPGQPPAEAKGTMHAELLMGGRYVEHHWTGNFMGMPFEGRGTDAYDNVAKAYESSWIDNMGTAITHSIGKCDAAMNSCTFHGEVWDPATGKKSTMRSVITWADDNNFRNEMYSADPKSGKEMKVMEIAATRKQ
jgi:hypothetical protein